MKQLSNDQLMELAKRQKAYFKTIKLAAEIKRKEDFKLDTYTTALWCLSFLIFFIMLATITPPKPSEYITKQDCLRTETHSEPMILPRGMSPFGIPAGGGLSYSSVDVTECVLYTPEYTIKNPDYDEWIKKYEKK